MAKTEKKAPPKLMAENEAEELRARLAEHEAAAALARKTEAASKYSGIAEFLDSEDIDAILEKTKEHTAGIASLSEDRNLYFSLDNIRLAIESARGAFDQQLRSVGVSRDELNEGS